MRRMFFAALVALWAVPALGQEVQVTFDGPPMALKELLPQLGKSMGRTLEASRQTENDIVLLRVKDAPAPQVLKRIAQVTGGEWRQEGSVLRLGRSISKATDPAPEQDRRRRGPLLAKALNEAVAEVGRQPAWSDDRAQQLAQRYHAQVQSLQSGGAVQPAAIGASTPVVAGIVRLLNAIGPEALAGLEPGQRLVLSNQPNPMQRRLPGGADAVLKEVARQHAQYVTAYKTLAGNDDRQIVFAGGSTPVLGQRANPDTGVGKSLLVIQSASNGLNVSLSMNDGAGNDMLQGSYVLSLPAQPSAPAEGGEPITLPPTAAAYAKALSESTANGAQRGMIRMMAMGGDKPISFEAASAGATAVKLSPEVLELVLNPQKHEPHALITAPILQKAATGNLIAMLPDAAIVPLARAYSTGTLTTNRLPSVLNNARLQMERSDGWTVVTPQWMVPTIKDRVNRVALGKLARALHANQALRLDQLATFSLEQVKPSRFGDLDAVLLQLLNPEAAAQALQALSEPALLRIYGTLSPAQRATLASGGSIPIRQLTTQQRQWLADEVFQGPFGPQLAPEPGAPPFMRFNSGVAAERTELLPNGVSLDSVLEIKIETKQAVLAMNQSTGGTSILNIDRMANALFQRELTNISIGPAPTWDRFRPAVEATYAVKVTLAPRVVYQRSYADVAVDTARPYAAYEGLPAAFQSAVQERLVLLREAFSDARGGAPVGGRRTIPPR